MNAYFPERMKHFGKMLENLYTAIEDEKNGERIGLNASSLCTMRDGKIQRFEYCIELTWKMLKMYLEQAYNVRFEAVYPTMAISQAQEVGFITQKEYQTLDEALKDRNRTSHIYKEEIADILGIRINGYYDLMHDLYNRMNL